MLAVQKDIIKMKTMKGDKKKGEPIVDHVSEEYIDDASIVEEEKRELRKVVWRGLNLFLLLSLKLLF